MLPIAMLLSINLKEGFQCLFVYDNGTRKYSCLYTLQPEVSSILLDQLGGGRDSTRGRDLCLQGNDLGVGCESWFI